MPYTRTPYTLDRVVRLLINLALFIAVIWLIKTLKTVLLPFLVACLIAYILEPMVLSNKKLLKLKRRGGAVFITLFEMCFITAILLYIFVPLIIDEITSMAHMLKHYADTEINIPYIPQRIHEFIKGNLDVDKISNYLSKEQMTQLAENALSTSWDIITGSISMILSVFSWLIVALYLIFIMLDYQHLLLGLKALVPPRNRKIVLKISNDIKNSMNHYFRGQALIAFIVGVLFSIGFMIIGLPMAVVFGLFIGVLNMVPYLQLISIIPAAFLCLAYTASGAGDFWIIAAETFAVYCIVQGIQDLFLTPKIMGKAMGLNPAIILLSLSIWGTLLGFIGLIIALPLTTLIVSYYERLVINRDKTNTSVRDALSE